jgi:23S rRNA pseudouridine955/2504/2580 synthase
MPKEQIKKPAVEHLQVTPDQAGRRIDNYLMGYLKDVPKTRIYKMLRKGEVRVNGSRVKPDYRLIDQDNVRVPPVYRNIPDAISQQPSPAMLGKIYKSIIYEDDFILAINKPAGLAVHAGSGEQFGVIELLRHLRADQSFLELVHRLDKPTSGCLLLAKEHRVLRNLHTMLQENQVKKSYLALLMGKLKENTEVTLPLRKNELLSGERMVQIHAEGKSAKTSFHLEHLYKDVSLVRIRITTGRTHQIRVHAASIGHPVIGDDKYGDRVFNRSMKNAGLQRMFLHAESLTLKLPCSGAVKTISAPLPDDLVSLLTKLQKNNHVKKKV